MTPHLVIGASGLVGGHLLHVLRAAGYDARGTYCRCRRPGLLPLDIADQEAVERLVAEVRPAVIHLPAGRTSVDGCELDSKGSERVNVAGPITVVRAARRCGATVVFFSSDYVFDGRAGPYDEGAAVNPICEYGRQKVAVERHLAAHGGDVLIVRTTVVYGWEHQGKNFASRLVKKLRAGATLRVPFDQVGTPTYAPDLAAAVVELVASGRRGLYHVAGPERLDRLAFARKVARAFDLDQGLIEGVSTAELGQAAPRPLNAGLRSERARALLITSMSGVREGLLRMACSGEPDGLRGSA